MWRQVAIDVIAMVVLLSLFMWWYDHSRTQECVQFSQSIMGE